MRKKPFKIFYNGLIPRHIRRRLDIVLCQQGVADEWAAMIADYQNQRIPRYQLQPKKKFQDEKIIWQYWGQGLDKLPEMAKLCFKSVDYYCGDYRVIRLTDATVSDYIDFPEFVWRQKNNPVFQPAFFADLLRLALLNVYGGVWLDASILLTDNLPTHYAEHDFFMFSRDPNSKNKNWGSEEHCYFNWQSEFKIRHLNSIIYAKRGSDTARMLMDLLLYFWQTQNTVNHYFFFQILCSVLQEKRIALHDMPLEDDTLPHLLQGWMNQPFDAKKLVEITAEINIHKLPVRMEKASLHLQEQQTFYDYFVDFF